jgi:hypothetical protein
MTILGSDVTRNVDEVEAMRRVRKAGRRDASLGSFCESRLQTLSDMHAAPASRSTARDLGTIPLLRRTVGVAPSYRLNVPPITCCT